MADRIRVDYEELANIATRFSTQADEIGEMERAIQTCMNALQNGGWIGQGANAFYAEMDELIMPAVRRMCEALEDSSHIIKEVSNIMEEAESESAAFFAAE